jgi:hypothetical protein
VGRHSRSCVVFCLILLTATAVSSGGVAFCADDPTLVPPALVGWGLNTSGETDVPDGNDFVAVAAGEFYSVGLRADGSLTGWGFNAGGQTNVPGGNDFAAVASGYAHSLALRADGSLAAWGATTDVPVGNDFVAIAAGGSHSLALRADGSLVGWGANQVHQTDVPQGTGFVAISAGSAHSLALRADGSLVGWGFNQFGQTNVPEGHDFVALAAGYFHSLALRADGSLVGWGQNDFGQCNVPEGHDFATLAAEYGHSLALRADGSLAAWGWNDFGQCDVPEGNDFVALAAGTAHSLAIRSDHEKPPVVEVTTDLVSLWPANHAMVPVTITASARNGDNSPEDLLVLCQVSSSQPDTSQGGGRHIGDVHGQDGFTAPVAIDLEHLGEGSYEATILLRAERDGSDRSGRVYTITVDAWSLSGNSSSAACTVVVPHSQGKGRGKK